VKQKLEFRPADVQGNILRGYRRERIRHLVLEVADAAAARRWIGGTVSGAGGLQVTTESPTRWTMAEKPPLCFNLGVTFEGLKALGVPASSLAGFPDEFREGMIARAVKLGDVGASAPHRWDATFATPGRVHVIATAHANDVETLDAATAEVVAAGGSRAFRLTGSRDGWNFDGDFVHFGYRDNISQPRFEGIHDPAAHPDSQPLAPLGTVLLGYESEYEDLWWSLPDPAVLGQNGAFNAFRILEQDVAGFEAFLDRSATALVGDPRAEELLPKGAEARIGPGLSRHGAFVEIVAAKLCGRWRNGVPLALSPDTPNPVPPVSLTNFDYHGGACPYGSHTRRANPRGGTIVQRAARHTRRIVRRGFPYGDAWDPGKPDGQPRGLLGSFLCANLGAQFEAVMCEWVNLGLQDPRITGMNDPLLGANEDGWFDIPLPSGGQIRLLGLPRLITTRGGAYTFLPGIPALRHIASL
jgi:deferrochelatase/peroxidase EfeB